MKINTSHSPYKQGFTLVELLVVIAIIASLATLGFVGGKRAMEKARKLESQVHLTDIVSALDAFYADNSTFPIVAGVSGSIDIAAGDSGATLDGSAGNGNLIQALCAKETTPTINARNITYLDSSSAANAPGNKNGTKNCLGARSGIDDNGHDVLWSFVDYWGHPYYVNWDANYDGVLNDPFSTNTLRNTVVAMARGLDHDNNVIKTTSPQNKIVKTW